MVEGAATSSETVEEPNVHKDSRWHTKIKKFSLNNGCNIEEIARQPYIINLNEPCHLVGSKIEDEADDEIFSPTLSAQVDSISIHRPSIISLKIKGVGTGIDDEGRKLSIIRRYAGVLFALFATFSYSVATLIVKMFQRYHPFTISIWRFQGMIFPTIPIILYYTFYEKKPVLKAVWPPTSKKALKNIFFITLRSLVGCSSTVMQIFALKYMNMADASVIVYSSPVFVLFVARIFLGEKAGYFSVVIAIITLCGVAVISRPPMLTGEPIDEQTLIGIIFALSCMLTATIVVVVLRHLRDVNYSIVTLGYGIEGTIECLIAAFAIDVFELPRTSLEWLLVGGLVFFTWCGQTGLVLALQLEQCGIVSLINSLDTCFAFILQFLFLGVVPDLFSITGASIVVSTVIITTFRKYIGTLPEAHPTRKKFGILLM